MEEIKLLGCPMCGKQPTFSLIRDSENVTHGYAYRCFIETDHFIGTTGESKEEASKAWNTRFNDFYQC